jgi:hypothetical protein
MNFKSKYAQMSSAPPKPKKQDWLHSIIQKCIQSVQTEENKKMVQVFLIDPILNYVLDRLFPYVLILCVLFVILTIMISMTLALVFMRLPGALGQGSIAVA